MKIIGLTGGIASGKSTVSRILQELGVQVIDGDLLAREVVQPGMPGLQAVAARFPGVVDQDGVLSRRKLAARVFSDRAELEALNEIMHPLIEQAFESRLVQLFQKGYKLVVYDSPLLIETGTYKRVDEVVAVWVPRHIQKARLMVRNELSDAEAEVRLAAQLPLVDKLRYADWVIDNTGSIDEARRQVVDMTITWSDSIRYTGA